MRILISGGTGDVGRAVSARLVKQGYNVRVIGLESGADIPGAEYANCDIMNYDDLFQQMRGCDAVVHLAAIRSPQITSGQETFSINAAGTFNVFEAAAAAGIRRIVQASSINALGCAWNITDIVPHYFPINEEHPTFTTDPYSFSKNVVEDIGAYYWRREGISSVSLRLPWVYPQGYLQSENFRERQQRNRTIIDALLAAPESERRARLAETLKRALDIRRQRQLEFAAHRENIWQELFSEDPLLMMVTIDRFNFWAFVDERDSAQAFENGLTADYEGSHALFINDHTNSINYDSKIIARIFYPEVTQWDGSLQGAESFVSIDKARSLIDFEPKYSVANLGRS